MLQNATVQTLATRDMVSLSKQLPTKIEGTFDLPKVREMITATSESHVLQFVETELVKLSALVNVGGNLTDYQVETFAKFLVDKYPNETIADFKICFMHGAMGGYGQIFRLDGIVIADWMKQYLEQKYEVLEKQLKNEREQYDKVIIPENSERDWHKEWLEAVNKGDGFKQVPHLTEEEIKAEGKPEPKRKVHPYNESDAQIRLREYREKLWVFQEQTVRERHPELTEEEIQERLKELKNKIIYEESRPKHTFPAVAKIFEGKKKKSA